MIRPKRQNTRRSGIGAIEIMLILQILLAILLAAVQFSFTLTAEDRVAEGCRQGPRCRIGRRRTRRPGSGASSPWSIRVSRPVGDRFQTSRRSASPTRWVLDALPFDLLHVAARGRHSARAGILRIPRPPTEKPGDHSGGQSGQRERPIRTLYEESAESSQDAERSGRAGSIIASASATATIFRSLPRKSPCADGF